MVFDLEDDNTIGTLPIHPYVEETDEILCKDGDEAQKPHNYGGTGLFCKFHTLFVLLNFFHINIYLQLMTCNLQGFCLFWWQF